MVKMQKGLMEKISENENKNTLKEKDKRLWFQENGKVKAVRGSCWELEKLSRFDVFRLKRDFDQILKEAKVHTDNFQLLRYWKK